MFNQRQLEIIDLLQTEDKVSVSELTQRFGVSLVTVRQDLKKLEDQGVLKRTHGGAIPVDNGYDTSTRMWNNYEQKLRIAQRAASMVSDGETVIVETGSTLKENGLEVLEEVCPLSARMIVNPVSMQMEADRIRKLVGAIREQLKIQS